MASIACVAGPDPGHLLPVAAIAIGLHEAGHDVVLASGGALLVDIAKAGPRTVTLPDLGPEPEDIDIAHVLWRRAATMAPATCDLLAPFAPDLVVTDTITTVGHFVADLLGVPSIEVLPHHLMDPAPDVPPVGLGRAPSTMPWRRRDDAHIRRQQAKSIEDARRLRTQVRASIGLGPVHAPAHRLVGVAPCLEYLRAQWPSDATIVGPLVWEPASWGEAPVPSGDEPLVVVTDTTASGPHDNLAARVITALDGTAVRLAVTSKDPEIADLAGTRSHVEVGTGSHMRLLAQASLAIGPGGGGFVGKSLASGVPLVVVPGPGDQRETARRIEVAGVGKRVRMGPAFERRLRIAALTALGDWRLAAAAKRCAEQSRSRGVPAAVEQIERWLPAR